MTTGDKEFKRLEEENKRLLRALMIVGSAKLEWYSVEELQQIDLDAVREVATV